MFFSIQKCQLQLIQLLRQQKLKRQLKQLPGLLILHHHQMQQVGVLIILHCYLRLYLILIIYLLNMVTWWMMILTFDICFDLWNCRFIFWAKADHWFGCWCRRKSSNHLHRCRHHRNHQMQKKVGSREMSLNYEEWRCMAAILFWFLEEFFISKAQWPSEEILSGFSLS